jgi:hypothetical protein
MSGPAIHHIVARRFLEDSLKKNYVDAPSRQFWKQMDKGSFAAPFHLGAQGPDFLFFNTNDWPAGGAIKSLAQTYWEVEEFIEDLVQKIKDLIPPEIWQAIDALETAVDRSATLSEIKQLALDVKKNIDALSAIIMSKIQEYVTDSVDLFSLLKHPQQDGQDFKEWWWFDTLHIRRTGRFMNELMRRSANYSLERSYTLGYLTHYSADVVGHPFVNAVAGGPYRTHAQRHKVVENFQDVWAFNKYTGGEFAQSKLSELYVIDGNPDKLPPRLNDFILSCIKGVYFQGNRPLYGKQIAPDDLDVAYRTWLIWFSKATNSVTLPPPKPYSITAEIVEEWDKFKNNVGDIAGYIGNSISGGGGILGLLKALAALILGPLALAAAAIDFILGEITTIAAAPIRFFLSLSYEALYNSYLNLRKGLVLNGFSFPLRNQLSDTKIQHMLRTNVTDAFGHNANSLPYANAYPARKFQPNNFPESHLVYPFSNPSSRELDTCTGFPEIYSTADASLYINGPLAFDPNSYAYYKTFAENGTSGISPPNVTAQFNMFARKARSGGLGNAVGLSEELYRRHLTQNADMEFVDFSLDSDRGYAFKSWRKVKDNSLLNSPLNDASTNVAVTTDSNVLNVVTDILYPDRSVL